MSAALLLIDTQNQWASANPVTTARIASAVSSLRGKLPILWSYINCLSPGEPFRAGQLDLTGNSNIFAEDFNGHAHAPSIKPSPEDWIIPKAARRVLDNMHVAPFLHAQGIDHLFVGGYSYTDCVVASAVGTADKGFMTTIVKDLTADRDDRLFLKLDKHLYGQKVASRLLQNLRF